MRLNEYLFKIEEMKGFQKKLRAIRSKLDRQGYLDVDDSAEYKALKNIIKEIEDLLNNEPKVCVSYCIGYRSYYSEVTKIGKTYFHRFEKMTKKNGYRCIDEIPEITQQMKDDMLSDSYYY